MNSFLNDLFCLVGQFLVDRVILICCDAKELLNGSCFASMIVDLSGLRAHLKFKLYKTYQKQSHLSGQFILTFQTCQHLFQHRFALIFGHFLAKKMVQSYLTVFCKNLTLCNGRLGYF